MVSRRSPGYQAAKVLVKPGPLDPIRARTRRVTMLVERWAVMASESLGRRGPPRTGLMAQDHPRRAWGPFSRFRMSTSSFPGAGPNSFPASAVLLTRLAVRPFRVQSLPHAWPGSCSLAMSRRPSPVASPGSSPVAVSWPSPVAPPRRRPLTPCRRAGISYWHDSGRRPRRHGVPVAAARRLTQ